MKDAYGIVTNKQHLDNVEMFKNYIIENPRFTM